MVRFCRSVRSVGVTVQARFLARLFEEVLVPARFLVLPREKSCRFPPRELTMFRRGRALYSAVCMVIFCNVYK
jgi:hypothetical protein